MRNYSVRGSVFSALFAALLIATSFMKVTLPFSPAPITLETLAVMLSGALLGKRYGTISVLIVIALSAIGFPVLGGRGGIALFAGPTAGYIISWPLSAFLIGLTTERLGSGKFAGLKLGLLLFVFGALLVYPLGVLWMMYAAKIPSLKAALVAGMIPFLPGDLAKSVIASFIVLAVRKVYPMERILGVDP